MTRAHLPYVLLRPVSSQPRMESIHILKPKQKEEMIHIWEEFNTRDVALACDIETNGLLAHDLDVTVQQIGFSDSRGSWSIDFRESYDGCYHDVLHGLMDSQVPLVFFNGIFDLAFLFRDIHHIIPGVGTVANKDLFELTSLPWFNFAHDAYSLERHLSGEGFVGQEHGLKFLQQALLGWEDKGDVELEEWLVANGCTKGNGKADKGQMWKAPGEILCKYNALDADSTWQLLTKVLMPVATEFKAVLPYQERFLNLVKALIIQQLAGVRIDKEKLEVYNQVLLGKIEEAKTAFLTHEDIAPHIQEYEQTIRDNHAASEPEKYKKVTIPSEPDKYTKQGQISKRWEQYQEKWANYQPEISARWTAWMERHEEVMNTTWFNMNSANDKKWLFYDKLGHTPIVFTDSEQPAVDSDAARFWGEPGKILTVYSELQKEQGYVSKCLEIIQEDSPGNWRLHTQWRAPGTNTGRLSGAGGFNLQQQPKTQGYLECFIPDEGCSFISADVSALEPHVLAEASQDKMMLKLYGPDAKPNDIYLFTGSQIDGFRETFRSAGYDPDNPTKEGIAQAKKECKGDRNTIKCLVLSAGYGAGPSKIRQSLALNGVEKSFEEVKRIHTAYWEAYNGVKQYESFLQSMWEKTGGYILNPVGHPICVNEMYVKDLINRGVQSAGHMILVIQLTEWVDVTEEMEIRWVPTVFDYHDESIIMLKNQDLERGLLTFKESYRRLNSILNGTVTIKSDPMVAKDMAEVKIE